MRRIAIVTAGRSDYGLLRPLVRWLVGRPSVDAELWVTGSHLSIGGTADWIVSDGFPVAVRIPVLLDADSPEATAAAIGLAVLGFGAAYGRRRPDLLVVLGDRFEVFAAAAASAPFAIPIAHIHGGELTVGAMDDAFRHAITHLSHLHFVAHPDYARRLRQLGEEAWRIHVSGAPGLDEIRITGTLQFESFCERYGLPLHQPFALATLHPLTRAPERTAEACAEWLAALAASGLDVLFTRPNADPGHAAITDSVRKYLARHERAWLVPDLGPLGYYSAMANAAVMVGNSSSGISEAASFGLPVVNIGDRQAGRLRPANVMDVPAERGAIGRALHLALEPATRRACQEAGNPFGDGHAGERIGGVLATVALDGHLRQKRFKDYGGGGRAAAETLACCSA